MQSQLTIVNPNTVSVSSVSIIQRLVSWITSLFGCWHLQMSRPFSHNGQAYRSCLHCGAQRKFNLKSWEMQGDYYYSRPTTRQLKPVTEIAIVRKAA